MLNVCFLKAWTYLFYSCWDSPTSQKHVRKCESMEPLCIAGENVKWCQPLWKTVQLFLDKLNIELYRT